MSVNMPERQWSKRWPANPRPPASSATVAVTLGSPNPAKRVKTKLAEHASVQLLLEVETVEAKQSIIRAKPQKLIRCLGDGLHFRIRQPIFHSPCALCKPLEGSLAPATQADSHCEHKCSLLQEEHGSACLAKFQPDLRSPLQVLLSFLWDGDPA